MFKKYNSIENSYRQKHIMKALEWYPELKDMKYSICEKIDGSNLQLYFEPNKEMKVGKRSKFLEKDEDFFGVWDVLNNYLYETSNLQRFCNQLNKPLRAFCEIYGQGIQKRIRYGEDKYIAFFDLEIDGEMQCQFNFERMMCDMDIKNLVPILGYANSLSEALEWNCDFDSKILGEKNNPAEGIVIKPYEKEILMGNGQRFVLKKKADFFSEKMSVKPGTKRTEEASHIIQAKMVFQSYINENRLQGIFSKHGEIQDMNEFGKYIQLMLADAKEDFLKDYDISKFDEKQLKKIYSSGGKHVAMMLKGYV